EQRVFWRRLFTAPDGTVQNIDTRRGQFTGALRRAIVYRDRICRTPWCGAPISQIDHVTRSADGGAESWDNGQGLCQMCNLAKEAPGWSATAASTGPPGDRDHVVTTRTPTGHRYESRPPPAELGLAR
ncbi:MAG: HNH endonuclease, partial [Mobilicoccus sp.]|nr:HNH endonuclease [Mobilicoccus sp.]